MHKDHLSRPVKVHICKDRTLTYRIEGEPVFNDTALPVFSVDTKDEAEKIIVLLSAAQYEEHPLLPGKVWYKMLFEKEELDYDDLETVTDRLQKMYELLLQSRKNS